MIVKEAVYKSCGECKRNIEQISEEVYGCDFCREPIVLNVKGKNHHDHLDISIHHKEKSVERMQFCSWKCVVAKLRKIKTDYFVSLPFLHYEKDALRGQRAKDFLNLVAN